MKRLFLIGLMFLTGSLAMAGQDQEALPEFNGQAAERIKSMRIAFMTNKLGLTTEESQKFWPIYNEYEQKQKQIRRKYNQSKNINLMNDTEVEKFVDSRFLMEQELLDLKRQYFTNLKDAISIRQIANIGKAEREFKTVILNEWRKRQRMRRRN